MVADETVGHQQPALGGDAPAHFVHRGEFGNHPVPLGDDSVSPSDPGILVVACCGRRRAGEHRLPGFGDTAGRIL